MSLSGSVGTVLFISAKLKLMRLGLCKEDLFTLLLRRGQLHHLMEVATIKIAEELYLMPHELMHWHEGGLLGGVKPVDQLVANIGEPDDCLEVIPDALVEFVFVQSASMEHCFATTLVHLVRPTS